MAKKKKSVPRGQNESLIVRSKTALRRMLRISDKTLGDWIARGMPVRPDGTFDFVEVARWRIHEAIDAASRKQKGSDGEDRYRKAKAEIEEMKLASMRGELVPRDDVEAANVAKVLAVKRALLALPKQLAPALAGREAREIQAYLTTRIEDVVARFSGVAIAPKKKRRRSKKKR